MHQRSGLELADNDGTSTEFSFPFGDCSLGSSHRTHCRNTENSAPTDRREMCQCLGLKLWNRLQSGAFAGYMYQLTGAR